MMILHFSTSLTVVWLECLKKNKAAAMGINRLQQLVELNNAV